MKPLIFAVIGLLALGSAATAQTANDRQNQRARALGGLGLSESASENPTIRRSYGFQRGYASRPVYIKRRYYRR